MKKNTVFCLLYLLFSSSSCYAFSGSVCRAFITVYKNPNANPLETIIIPNDFVYRDNTIKEDEYEIFKKTRQIFKGNLFDINGDIKMDDFKFLTNHLGFIVNKKDYSNVIKRLFNNGDYLIIDHLLLKILVEISVKIDSINEYSKYKELKLDPIKKLKSFRIKDKDNLKKIKKNLIQQQQKLYPYVKNEKKIKDVVSPKYIIENQNKKLLYFDRRIGCCASMIATLLSMINAVF